MSKSFPFYRQLDRTECGSTCLRMIAKFYGKSYSAYYLRDLCKVTKDGVSVLSVADAAEDIGLRSFAAMVTYDDLAKEVPLPCMIYWRQRHFIVAYKIRKNKVYVADPEYGKIKYSKEEFLDGWINSKIHKDRNEGLVVLLEPTPEFYNKDNDDSKPDRAGFRFLIPYFKPYKSYLIQLFLGLAVLSVIQLIFPFLTQAVVDYGIKNQNLNFIYLILAAQFMLFFSQMSVEMIRGWLLLHLGARINISIISDFLVKLMKLPITFYDSKTTGDLLQRIQDNRRLEEFLSSSSLTILFSLFNLIIFGIVLVYYNLTIFTTFLIGSSLYAAWVLVFMKRRALLDFMRFDQMAGNASSLIELLDNMPEIKLNNSEKRRRWEWEEIQIKLFRIAHKSLALAQYQTIGGRIINESKNILITFIAAKSVIEGQLTLGMMLAVQYIIGQLNAPINEFINFAQSGQDAKMSLERMAEVHNQPDEESVEDNKIKHLGKDTTIKIRNLSFQYGTRNSHFVLRDINMEIPEGKVTAIVGASGSGKTTLLKLLLKFYAPSKGSISIGNIDLENISARVWRQHCGAVMQDGALFSDTIGRNISESTEEDIIDRERLKHAVHTANIESFVEEMVGGYNARVGRNGVAVSGGEKQRILIARAVYKDPQFILFDEATSALDSQNERIIMENLEEFYLGRTVVVIAHRLSTVKNADQIIVLDKGAIIERGTHEELTELRGAYFTLVKNQLELGG